MGVRPVGPQLSSDVICGDYLQVSAQRSEVFGHGPDEGCARVEHVERLAAEHVEKLFAGESLTLGVRPVPVVWCHGLPGPVILHGGDVRVLDVASPRRVEHDSAHPWWPPVGTLLRGAYAAGDTPHRRRRTHDRRVEEFAWPEPSEHDRVPRRPTTFTKPAGAVLVGDYLGVHPNRWPHTDREIDEGFTRVEHVRLLDVEAASRVFFDPLWHTDVVVLSLYGLPGVLLLRGTDEIDVLAGVNFEREVSERRSPWEFEPVLALHGSREATETEVAAAARVDAACRPQVDEAELYPSQYRDPAERRMALEAVHGFRSVPLSALPWPHWQSDCPLGELAASYLNRVPDVQAAHAEASLSRAGARIRAECEYHQVDWPRLVRIFDESLADSDDGVPWVKDHPEFEQLSPEDQRWVLALVADPIRYEDGTDALVNGQHRLCAMRFAGVTHCPVMGHYLPGTEYGPAQSARVDARTELTASWRRWAVRRGWPAWLAASARWLPTVWRTRLLNTRGVGRATRG